MKDRGVHAAGGPAARPFVRCLLLLGLNVAREWTVRAGAAFSSSSAFVDFRSSSNRKALRAPGSSSRRRNSDARRHAPSMGSPLPGGIRRSDHEGELSSHNHAVATNEAQEEKPSSSVRRRRQRLVLIGGGHAHVQVIKALGARPQGQLEVVLIDAQTSASYSGMVPGCIAGMYRPHDTLIDLVPLAEASRIQFVQGIVTGLCLSEKRVTYRPVDSVGTGNAGAVAPSGVHDASRTPGASQSLSFDVVSVDIGSSTRDWDRVPGTRQHSIPTRPIRLLVERLDEARNRWLDDTKAATGPREGQNVAKAKASAPSVVVVGGGAAGLELAFAIMARWRPDVPDATCTIVNAGPQLLSSNGGGGGGAGDVTTSKEQEELLHHLLREKQIQVMNSCVVQQVGEDHVTIVGVTDSVVRRISATHCIWAAGAGPAPLARTLLEQRQEPQSLESKGGDTRERGLDMTEEGWIKVGATLQSTSHPFVFAAGDCASIGLDDVLDEAGRPSGSKDSGMSAMRVVPKAGVYAVRAGPILIDNLTRYLDQLSLKQAGSEQPLVKYQPQDDFLKLIVCDREEAIGFRFGLALRGRWVWKLKDRIDQTFMSLFRIDVRPGSDKATDHGKGQGSPKYDTSQYDSGIDADPSLVAPKPDDAAALLRRQDEEVDFLVAWKVLRSMANDGEYRDAVLARCNSRVEHTTP